MSLNLPDTGLSPQELKFEIERGGRFVVFQYCISALIITFKRPTSVHFIKAGESAAIKSLPFTLISLILGWWGIPWGFIYTPQVIYKNLSGGIDVTKSVRAAIQSELPAGRSLVRETQIHRFAEVIPLVREPAG